MKSRDSLVRLKRFQAEEKRRRVAQIEAMIAEFSRMVADLDREIAAEEQRSGIADAAHFAYSTYARAALDEALEDVARAQSLEGREKGGERAGDLRDMESAGLRAAGA